MVVGVNITCDGLGDTVNNELRQRAQEIVVVYIIYLLSIGNNTCKSIATNSQHTFLFTFSMSRLIILSTTCAFTLSHALRKAFAKNIKANVNVISQTVCIVTRRTPRHLHSKATHLFQLFISFCLVWLVNYTNVGSETPFQSPERNIISCKMCLGGGIYEWEKMGLRWHERPSSTWCSRLVNCFQHPQWASRTLVMQTHARTSFL